MECAVEEEGNVSDDKICVGDKESLENFQKFIHELFEQNGILNDLRAYLRGHIVNVLKSAETGDPLMCKKHFTQRLEYTYQALNILIAEYLLRMEFNYSLSVFVSEIPLSNMVFEFARILLKTTDSSVAGLYFEESDVWSILNYLGIKCDSEHALKIYEMYNGKQGTSLLSCILSCIQLHDNAPIYPEKVYTSDETLSSGKTTGTEDISKIKNKNASLKCKHYVFCKACQNRVKKLKQNYEKKKLKFEKRIRQSNVNDSLNTFTKTVSVMEQSLIDEMFHQLKTVYETELDMVKEEEERKVKRSLATHAIQLEKHREELEELYKTKEAKLEENVQQKKKFLWGLARALREQHESMARAMLDVKLETDRIVEKENNLKKQLQEAEKAIKNKGDSMRNQISNELKVLAGHLESMKKERDIIDRERRELDNLKQIFDKNDKVLEEYRENKEDLKQHYDLLKEDLDILKRCIENNKVEHKCLIEKDTVTDGSEVKNLMNNEINVRSDDKLKDQVINNFKKQKNINFSHSEDGVIGPRDSSSSDSLVDIQMLKQENERLKALASQQSVRLQSLLSPRPRIAPLIPNSYFAGTSATPHASASMSSNRACGEQLNLFPNIQSRVLFPGDSIPFIGVLADRHHDNRRHLIHQWRALRHRLSATKAQPPQVQVSTEVSNIESNSGSAEKNTTENELNLQQPSQSFAQPDPSASKSREKSPKSVLREAKQKLRNNNSVKENLPIHREKSPNAMLKEAKLRLRKLEIEAEAVEQSYLDFRKRHELKVEKSCVSLNNEGIVQKIQKLDIKRSISSHKLKENKTDNTRYKESPEMIKQDFDKYLREYQTKDIGLIYFPNKNTIIDQIKPIPASYSKFCDDLGEKNVNHLETPLCEFRKLYQKGKSEKVIIDGTLNDSDKINNENNEDRIRLQMIKKKEAELKLLKDNISKIYNIPEQNLSESRIKATKLNLQEELAEIKNLESIHDNETKIDEAAENKNILLTDIDEIRIKDSESSMQLNRTGDQISELESKIVDKYEENQNNADLNEIIDLNLNEEQENKLIVEVENTHEENNIQVTDSKDLLLIVESSIDNAVIEEQKISTQLTVLVSPKNTSKDDKIKDFNRKGHFKTDIPDKITEYDILNALYQSEANDISSGEILKLENSSELEKDGEYVDDFSADVDNYNSRSDYGKNSPISLPKTDDDNFWDS